MIKGFLIDIEQYLIIYVYVSDGISAGSRHCVASRPIPADTAAAFTASTV